MQLLTIQHPGVDIVNNIKPTDDYKNANGAYYDLAQFLGWEKWIWCLKDMTAFTENDYLTYRAKGSFCLWVLDIPEDRIVWASLERQCEGQELSSYLFPRWQDVEYLKETPMGLVKSPVKPEWVISTWIITKLFERVQGRGFPGLDRNKK